MFERNSKYHRHASEKDRWISAAYSFALASLSSQGSTLSTLRHISKQFSRSYFSCDAVQTSYFRSDCTEVFRMGMFVRTIFIYIKIFCIKRLYIR